MNEIRRLWNAPLLAVALIAPSVAGAQEISYSGGLQYAGATYIFDQRTDAFTFSNSLRLRLDRLDIGVSVPVIFQNGGLVTLVGGGVPLPTGGTQAGTVSRRKQGTTIGTRRSGRTAAIMGVQSMAAMAAEDSLEVVFDEAFAAHVGDPTLSASLEVHSGYGAVRSLRVHGSAKTPLNSAESGFGSGEWDYGAGSSLVLDAGPALTFLDVSYWWFGDLPDLQLENAVSVGAGASIPAFDGSGSVLLTIIGMSATIENVEAPVTVGASLGHSWGSRGFLSVGAGVGLTESAPDFFVMVGWSAHAEIRP